MIPLGTPVPPYGVVVANITRDGQPYVCLSSPLVTTMPEATAREFFIAGQPEHTAQDDHWLHVQLAQEHDRTSNRVATPPREGEERAELGDPRVTPLATFGRYQLLHVVDDPSDAR